MAEFDYISILPRLKAEKSYWDNQREILEEEKIINKIMKSKEEALERIATLERETAELKKFIEKKDKYPESIDDVEGRTFYIDDVGQVESSGDPRFANNFSTKERAEAMLALGQLVELHRAINPSGEGIIWTAIRLGDRQIYFYFTEKDSMLYFKTQFKDLIETVKKGL